MNIRALIIALLLCSGSLYALDTNTKLQLSAGKSAGTFNHYTDGSKLFPVRNIYPADINGDGIDEIFFAGFETQPNTPEEYSNTSVFIYAWKDGILQDITEQWLPGAMNQVEAVGDIDFGDFNGDGLLDVYLSANADMDHLVNSYALINKGGQFEKINLGENKWEHGAFAADINQDGYDDVVTAAYTDQTAIYMGSSSGLTKISLTTYIKGDTTYSGSDGYGSGIAVADFMHDGTQTLIITDSISDGDADTKLVKVIYNNGTPAALDLISILPAPLLTLPDWVGAGVTGSHDVRAEPFDFSGDGIMDVLVFSRAWLDENSQWPNISTIQFLKNKGEGVFEDVTTEKLTGYDNASGVSYNPVIADFNNDGLMDVFSGDASFTETHNSNTILLQQTDGTFADTGRAEFNQLLGTNLNGAIGNVAQGSDNKYYFVWQEFSSTTGLNSVSYSELLFTDQADNIKNQGAVLDFASNGLRYYALGQWSELHAKTATQLSTADIDGNGQQDIIVDFGKLHGLWLYKNSSQWVKLHSETSKMLTTGDMDGNGQDDIIISFENHGLWVWRNNNTWGKLHSTRPEALITADMDNNGQDEVIIDFGTRFGVWVYQNNSNWRQLHSLSSTHLASGDIDNNGQDDLIIDFGSRYGLWKYQNNSNWSQLHAKSSVQVITGDLDGNQQDDIIIDFGSQFGLWTHMNNDAWTKIHNASSEQMVTRHLDDNNLSDLLIDFGSQHGLWAWKNNTAWEQLHSDSPTLMGY